MDMRSSEEKRFVDEEAGLTLVEYALVCFLIAITCLLLVVAVGTNTSALYTTICQAVATATGGGAGC